MPRPPLADLPLLAVAVVAVSTSGPLMASAAVTVPVLAIAMWRNALSLVVLGPADAAATTCLRYGPLARESCKFASGAGLFLALHFATWVPSLDYTSVASATALVATQPVWQAMMARLQGDHVARAVWIGIALAVVGAGWLAGADFSVSRRALEGDGLAAAAAVFAAVYIAAGRSGPPYGELADVHDRLLHGRLAVLLLAICLVGGVRLSGWSAGVLVEARRRHGRRPAARARRLQQVLRTTSPTVVSLTILLEVPGAALLAWLWLGQTPRLSQLPGALLLLAGIAIVAIVGAQAEEASPD